VPSHETKWTIHSDLPEFFNSEGVLYTTAPVLSPFNLKDGTPLSEEMRTQVNNGFTTIDDSFEVFFFHTTSPPAGHPGRRIVVYVKNNGDAPATLFPRQAITTEGLIGTVHDMENNLARQVMSNGWDTLMESVTIQPGRGTVVAAGIQFAAPAQSPDSSTSRNCFGVMQALVEPAGTANLEVSVIAIPAAPAGSSRMLAEKYLTIGADSGEGVIDLSTPPSECQVRRSTGVFKSATWKSDPLVIDAAALADAPLSFPMAVPQVQSSGCPEAQQTAPLVLHSAASRPDTVGNYMMEYLLAFEFTNSGTAPRAIDVRFGKDDADVGLAWQLATGATGPTAEALRALPVEAGWAGPKQTADLPDDTRSMLTQGKLTIPPGESIHLGARFMIVGNASLPFTLHVTAE
jgi:hypothetical protein